MTVLDLQGIITRGGGLDISVKGFSVVDLQGFATRASSSGARLTFRDAGKLSVIDLQGIATRGGGNVVFVF